MKGLILTSLLQLQSNYYDVQIKSYGLINKDNQVSIIIHSPSHLYKACAVATFQHNPCTVFSYLSCIHNYVRSSLDDLPASDRVVHSGLRPLGSSPIPNSCRKASGTLPHNRHAPWYIGLLH